MSDVPQAPAAVPSPAQTVPQAAAPVQPPAPQPQPAESPVPEIKMTDTIRFTGKDGQQRRATVSEMLEALDRPASPSVDPEVLAQAQLWERARNNDPEAINQLIDGLKPAPSAAPPQPGTQEHRFAEMEKRLADTEAKLAQAARTTGQIDIQRGKVMINATVKSVAAELPALARLTDPSSVVTRYLSVAKQDAQDAGADLGNPQIQRQLFTQALSQAEAECAYYAQVYGGQQPNHSADQSGIQNDQSRPPATQVGPPPGYAIWPDGTLRDMHGRQYIQQAHGAVVPAQDSIPGTIPSVPWGGGPVGAPTPVGPNQSNQRVAPGTLQAKMRARAAQLNQQA